MEIAQARIDRCGKRPAVRRNFEPPTDRIQELRIKKARVGIEPDLSPSFWGVTRLQDEESVKSRCYKGFSMLQGKFARMFHKPPTIVLLEVVASKTRPLWPELRRNLCAMLPFCDRTARVARTDIAPIWTRSFPISKQPQSIGEHLRKKRFN